MTTENINGARRTFGPQETEKLAGSVVSTFGLRREHRVNFNYKNLPGAVDNDEVHESIPAGSHIVSAYVYFTEAFDSTSGTTTVDVGLTEPDGTAIDADGLVVDVTANGSVAGYVVGGGALVGANTAAEGQVTAAASTNDLTAGAGVIVVEYLAPVA